MATPGVIEKLVAEVGFSINSKDIDVFTEKLKAAKTSINKMAAAGTVLLATLGAITRSFAVNATATAKIAERANLSVRDYQKLAAAVEIGGESVNGLTSSLQSLADVTRDLSISAALNPSGAAGLRKLGVGIRTVTGELKTSDKLFLDIVRSANRLPDALARASLKDLGIDDALARFILIEGPEGIQRLIAEAEKTSIFFDDDQVKGAREFSKELRTLRLNLSGLKNSIGAVVTPKAIGLLKWFDGITKGIKAFIDSNPQTTFYAIATALGFLSVIITTRLVHGAIFFAITAIKQLAAALVLLTLNPVGIAFTAGIIGISLILADLLGLFNEGESYIKNFFGSFIDNAILAFKVIKEIRDNIAEVFSAFDIKSKIGEVFADNPVLNFFGKNFSKIGFGNNNSAIAPSITNSRSIENSSTSNASTNNVVITINTNEAAQDIVDELESLGVIANRTAFDNFSSPVVR